MIQTSASGILPGRVVNPLVDLVVHVSPSALPARVALALAAWISACLTVVLAVAVVAFVGIGREPVAGVGPGGVYGRGSS